MKKQKKFLATIALTTILAILFSTNVLANDNETIIKDLDYSAEFKRWLVLSDEEKANSIVPRMYEVDDTSTSEQKTTNPISKLKLLKASSQSYYNLRNVIPDNLVIRNQGQTGLCWAFASIAPLETNLALSNKTKGINTSKVYDYSERHMEYATSKTFANNVENTNSFNREVATGGNYYLSQAYLTNGTGSIDESEMPFENNTDKIDISEIQNKTVTSEVYDTVEFSNYQNKSDSKKEEIMNQIKKHIQNYGAVYCNIHGNSSSGTETCYNSLTYSKYCDSSHIANHAVAIVGWIDYYNKDNFSSDLKPQNNGAWIVKNSWGSNFGDNGLMYVSYEDANVATALWGIVKASDKVDYDNLYQYDFYGYSKKISVSTDTKKFMLYNTFDKNTTSTEYLTQVALTSPGTYKCKVYVNPNGTSVNSDSLQQVELEAGDTETIGVGYHTLEFANPVAITGNEFVVLIEIEVNNTLGNLLLESKTDTSTIYDNVKTETGKCFLASGNNPNAADWVDLGTQQSGDSTIKAFTTNTLVDHSIKNIEIVTPPTTTSYIEGENFDKTGMKLKVNYNDNTSADLDDSAYTIKNGTNLSTSQNSVTISYEGKTVEQAITVEKNTVTTLTITTPPTKVAYKEGQTFDITGMVIKATYKDGTVKEVTQYKILDGNNMEANQTGVTISYGDKIVTQAVTVAENPLISISVKTEPSKTKYFVGESFDKTGMVIEGTFTDGDVNEIIEYTVENGTNLTKSSTGVTIKYKDKTVTQPITVEEKAENSNFDNAKCDVGEIKVSSSTESIKVKVSGIERNLTNDSVEYYYYLSTNKNENNISDWVKITEAQTQSNSLEFNVDIQNLKNSGELDDANSTVYLYIKEVATKQTNQSVYQTKALPLTLSNETEEIVEGTENNSTSNTKENTITKLPYVGVRNISILIIIIAVLGAFAYIRYKNLSKYVK